MANPRPPAKLNFQDPNWDAWRSSFQTFRAETNLDREDDEIQISTLMYSMGPEAERVLGYFDTGPTRGTHTLSKSRRTYDEVLAKSYRTNDLGKSQSTHDQVLGKSQSTYDEVFDKSQSTHDQVLGKSQSTHGQVFGKSHTTHDQVLDKSQRTYDEVLSKFDWYFKAKKKNLMTLRRAFQNRVQLRSETADEFCDALKKCGLECEFVDLEERVRDQFVFGVRNKGLSEKLEQLFVINPVGYTLEMVVLAAKAFERSYSQDFLSHKPKEINTSSHKPKEINTLSHKQKDTKDFLYHKPKDTKEILSHKQKEINTLSLKQKDTKEKRVRSLRGSIKIMAPCPELY